jgi:predicted glycosyltransferase
MAAWMARNSTYNILMYSHDSYGLGHIRRTMAIAAHLLAPRSPAAFLFPSRSILYAYRE